MFNAHGELLIAVFTTHANRCDAGNLADDISSGRHSSHVTAVREFGRSPILFVAIVEVTYSNALFAPSALYSAEAGLDRAAISHLHDIFRLSDIRQKGFESVAQGFELCGIF